MKLTEDSPSNIKGQRVDLTTFISKHALVNSFSHRWLAPSVAEPNRNRSDLILSRDGSRLTLEETSPWTSLMAGEPSLGPSDAPCLGEASTAHGVSLFTVTLIHTKAITVSVSPASSPDHVHHLLSPNLPMPELSPSPQICSTAPTSRRTYKDLWPTKAKLGFCLEGSEPNFGPLTLQRPKPISNAPTLNDTKPRSVFPCFLFSCCRRLGRFHFIDGRRHHRRVKSPSLLWLFNHTLRTLELVLNLAKSYDYKSLKVFSLLFPNLLCWKNDCGSMSKYSSTATFAKDSKYRLYTITNKPQPSPNGDLEQSSSDFKIVVNGSPTFALLWLQSLLPLRTTSPAPSSTSLRLLTVTILPSIDSFVEALSTNRDLTCIQKLSSLGLKALMEHLSICFNYLLVFLGNAPLCNALNFGIFVPLFSMYLNFI